MSVSTAHPRQQWGGMLLAALLYGAGGAIFCLLVLWIMQAIPGSRVLNPVFEAALLGFGFLVAGFAGWAALRWLARVAAGTAAMVVLAWALVYLLLWMITRITATRLSLPIFVGAWLLTGLAVAAALGTGRKPAPQPHQRMARAASNVTQSSAYGRIPADTVVLLTKFTRDAAGPALLYLPNDTPDHIRHYTTRAVASTMMRDWWDNGNIEGLATQDIADIQSFVALAAAVAIGVGGWQHATACAAYRATLAALLDDWLQNWNDTTDGPPKR
ncbi:hypothetical protein F8S13_24535 [Chloroflexia bacterium SDU3-3]|nr:hypothetical protein F8S13_24535 [Chloroflexia bacterium SDU3-3]